MAKIAIVGVGAMGGIYAGLLADAGNEVWAVDVWQDHVDAITSKGLRVEGASGDRTVTSVHATTKLAEAGQCDLYIIATKADGVAPAAQAIKPLAGPQSVVLTIQNGLGAAERIQQYMPLDNVLLGVAEGFGASIKGPGHVHHNAMKRIRIGECSGGMTDRLQAVEKIWQDAGFNVQAYADIEQLIWEKFVCNVTFSAPCTTFNKTIGEVMADPASWHIAMNCGREAFACGKAKGVNFTFDDVDAYITDFGSKMPDARPSMLLDHLNKKRCEIDAINGMVPVVGRELGIPTPYNDVVSDAVRAREEAF